MYNPISTYRIQFHKGFTFEDLDRRIPYLHKLGISTIYASPIFESVPGSIHGYDVINPHRINPEIGNEEQLVRIREKLARYDMGWIQDIVPNHMAYHHGNPWLIDVLTKGRDSAYASHFDINWDSPLENGRIMAPFLGSSAAEAIKKGELVIATEQDNLVLKYYDSIFPLRELSQVTLRPYLRNLDQLNRDHELLQKVADEQHYRLCPWQETDRHINYRRFFIINNLICLRMHDQQVFNHYHSYIRRLLDDDLIQGLRVDHIDGLYDPGQYLLNLRELAGDSIYIVVEKILQPGEKLPREWPVQGSTGYDFLAMVNNLLTDKNSEARFTRLYRRLTGENPDVIKEIQDKKRQMLYGHMYGELSDLSALCKKSFPEAGQVDPASLENAIGEFLVKCPVYRYYGNRFPLDDTEAEAVKAIIDGIRPGEKEAARVLENILLGEKENEKNASEAAHFYRRCMQLTGPLMAKGVEDTLMYTYNRFISHNEVGDSPAYFGFSTEDFHEEMLNRQEHQALSMNATSTHDTKRGEDVRARLNILSDLDKEWTEAVQSWQQMNAGLKQADMPDANDEYFIYQTLIGAYPSGTGEKDKLKERLEEYLVKALREAKVYSGWNDPDQQYEKATLAFAAKTLNRRAPFWKSFFDFHQRIVKQGMINSLVQVVLKLTCPGIPDIYQGTELWDLSLVDPDNRRDVDYEHREHLLQEAMDNHYKGIIRHFFREKFPDAGSKIALIHILLKERRQYSRVFTEGLYVPLQAEGAYKDHILCFARRYAHTWCLVVLPLHLIKLCKAQGKEPEELDWSDTAVRLPAEAPSEWSNLFMSGTALHGKPLLKVKDLFKDIPMAVLRSASPTGRRGAGILLSVTSLPSAFGIGDMGPEARAFASFLSKSGQKYWHLLPLNPTEGDTGNSPYSSCSALAGNTLLISPELLAEEGLLSQEELDNHRLPATDAVDYEAAYRVRQTLFETAYDNFCDSRFALMQKKFRKFCRKESYWLDGFALFMALRKKYQVHWTKWPDKYRKRDPRSLKEFSEQHEDQLQRISWLQFIFHRQWHQLRHYCHKLGIHMLGDLPFYLSHDSAEVWTNPDLFNLDKEGNISGIAGVPPDYFSETGQLWHMPTFRWDRLKSESYAWWLCRIRKNLGLFDRLRLDHFRAFDHYWEVPAGEETAVKGTWKQGPGEDFFRFIKNELGYLPFIVEDLGYDMESVYELRDRVGVYGMKVLQFAFGDNMPHAVDIPHNYPRNCMVYTGTHDNNTTLGWYRQELGEEGRKRLNEYAGGGVNSGNVHLVLARMAYASVADIAILPVQDVLGLDETKRVNIPGTALDNWKWRLLPGQTGSSQEELLNHWVTIYGRKE